MVTWNPGFSSLRRADPVVQRDAQTRVHHGARSDLTGSLYKVVLQKAFLAQIRQLDSVY